MSLLGFIFFSILILLEILTLPLHPHVLLASLPPSPSTSPLCLPHRLPPSSRTSSYSDTQTLPHTHTHTQAAVHSLHSYSLPSPPLSLSHVYMQVSQTGGLYVCLCVRVCVLAGVRRGRRRGLAITELVRRATPGEKKNVRGRRRGWRDDECRV